MTLREDQGQRENARGISHNRGDGANHTFEGIVISRIADGQIRIKNPRDTVVSGHAVMAPMIDLETIGAGGGSIAYLDAAGGFNVGPRSAGSEPGPACYNRGGTEPTVTDAQVVLGGGCSSACNCIST